MGLLCLPKTIWSKKKGVKTKEIKWKKETTPFNHKNRTEWDVRRLIHDERSPVMDEWGGDK